MRLRWSEHAELLDRELLYAIQRALSVLRLLLEQRGRRRLLLLRLAEAPVYLPTPGAGLLTAALADPAVIAAATLAVLIAISQYDGA